MKRIQSWSVVVVLAMVAGRAFAVPHFSDDFESETVGASPSQWVETSVSGTATVIDEITDPGAVYAGDKSLQLEFVGSSLGGGFGIATDFAPITVGSLKFASRIDDLTTRVQLMALFGGNAMSNSTQLTHINVVDGFPNYMMAGMTAGGQIQDTGVPVAFGEYVLFELQFNTISSTVTLFINGTSTNIVDYPLQHDVGGVTFLRSAHVSEFDGYAKWYLDDVTVTAATDTTVIPEPSSVLLAGLGVLAVLQLRRRPAGAR